MVVFGLEGGVLGGQRGEFLGGLEELLLQVVEGGGEGLEVGLFAREFLFPVLL